MTKNQKRVLEELLNLCYSQGFDFSYPLEPIAKKLNIEEPLYDNNTNTGILWEFGPHGSGHISARGNWPNAQASIYRESADEIAHYCRTWKE